MRNATGVTAGSHRDTTASESEDHLASPQKQKQDRNDGNEMQEPSQHNVAAHHNGAQAGAAKPRPMKLQHGGTAHGNNNGWIAEQDKE